MRCFALQSHLVFARGYHKIRLRLNRLRFVATICILIIASNGISNKCFLWKPWTCEMEVPANCGTARKPSVPYVSNHFQKTHDSVFSPKVLVNFLQKIAEVWRRRLQKSDFQKSSIREKSKTPILKSCISPKE